MERRQERWGIRGPANPSVVSVAHTIRTPASNHVSSRHMAEHSLCEAIVTGKVTFHVVADFLIVSACALNELLELGKRLEMPRFKKHYLYLGLIDQ
jgi:hypothetical protein